MTLVLALVHYHVVHTYYHYRAPYAYGFHPASGFGTMIAHAAVHATVWMMLTHIFHGLGATNSIILGVLILALAWFYLTRRGAY